MDEMFGRCAGSLPYNNDSTLQSSLSQLYRDHVRFTAYFEGLASGYDKFSFPLTPKVLGNNPEWLKNIASTYSPA